MTILYCVSIKSQFNLIQTVMNQGSYWQI